MSISFSNLRAQTYKNVQTFNNLFNHHPNDVIDPKRASGEGFSKEKMIERQERETKAQHDAGNTNYNVGYSDRPCITSEGGYSWSNGIQDEAYHVYKWRNHENDRLSNVLKDNNINLSPDEKISISVDRDLNISVSGLNDSQKEKSIEDTLNNHSVSGRKYAWALLEQVNGAKRFNGLEDPLEEEKYILYDQVKNKSGVDINDLKLDKNGEIIGGNEAFQKLINGSAYIGLQSTKSFVSDLKKLLTYGIDNVNDMNRTIDFQNNELIDKDVQYGFGKDQLQPWFDSFMKGKSAIDTFF
ncbi:hypothetical protein [Clostridium estertheticum]|uniref:hypothetical protein n=2 Tax=Clostridium estertheticum TaxID=238834 RepID=UPI0027150EAB|nr:hypothetical protein [Clostridium estertheticum]WLC82058.1 DUF4885 domain-containing protein [Clostridium estertheticum]